MRHLSSPGRLNLIKLTGMMHVIVSKKLRKYFNILHEAADKNGRPMRGVEGLADKLRAAGFEDVEVHIERLPIATWPKDKQLAEIGAYTQMAHTEGFKSYGTALFTRVHGMDAEEAAAFFTEVEKEVASIEAQLYTLRYIRYALLVRYMDLC